MKFVIQRSIARFETKKKIAKGERRKSIPELSQDDQGPLVKKRQKIEVK